MTDLATYKSRLEARLEELDERMNRIEEDLDVTADRDLEDQAVELEDDQVLEGMGAASLKEVAAIRAALKRIEDGSYGTCAKCGGEISEARLDAVPTAAVCASCARG